MVRLLHCSQMSYISIHKTHYVGAAQPAGAPQQEPEPQVVDADHDPSDAQAHDNPQSIPYGQS